MLTSAAYIDSRTIAELSPQLLRYAMRLISHRQDAEDLVQETWISALRSASSFAGRSGLRTWLLTILRRRAIDRFRRRPRVEAFDEERWCDGDQAVESGQALLELRASGAWATRALAELDGLPALERDAVLLCDVRELEREEAAQRLDVTRGHLRVLLHRGRIKLEGRLRELGYGSEEPYPAVVTPRSQ